MAKNNAKKAPDEAVQGAAIAIENGSSLRREAGNLGISHVALQKRIRQLSVLRGFGEFDSTDVAIILAVAGAGIPGGLTYLADFMQCGLVDLMEVCAAYGRKVTVR